MTTQHMTHRSGTPAAEALPLSGPPEGTTLVTIAATGEQPSSVDADATVSVSPAARTGLRSVRRGANGVVRRIPGTLRAARSGFVWTVETLQRMPDGTLRSIAATSIGLGAGLSFTRAGRLATLVGVVPAVVVEAAIAVRPIEPSADRPAAE